MCIGLCVCVCVCVKFLCVCDQNRRFTKHYLTFTVRVCPDTVLSLTTWKKKIVETHKIDFIDPLSFMSCSLKHSSLGMLGWLSW